eukprot:scaffold101062_cov20-Tisochrysis_lutea.AAC.3
MGSHLQGGHRVKGGNASVDEFCWALTCSDSSASRTAQGGAALGEMVWQAHACREGKDGIAMVQRAKKRQKVVLFGKDGLASSRLQGGVQVRGDNAWPRQVDKVLPARSAWSAYTLLLFLLDGGKATGGCNKRDGLRLAMVHFEAICVLLGDGECAQYLMFRGDGDGEEGVQVACLAQYLIVCRQAGLLLFILHAVMQAQGLLQQLGTGPLLPAHNRRVFNFAGAVSVRC